MKPSYLLLIGLWAGCGGDDVSSTGSPIPDGPSGTDTGAAAVEVVTCPSTPDATVTTVDGILQYMPPATTINRGQIVRFQTSSTHDVAPRAGGADPSLVVGFNQSKCFRFNQAGTQTFFCTVHFFEGTITVR